VTATLLFIGALALGVVTCRGALALVRRLEILDLPNERSSHDRPTPRGGGLGILAALLPAAAVGVAVLENSPGPAVPLAVLGAVVLLATLGYVDDRRDVRPILKLVLQAAAAIGVVAVAGGVTAATLPGVGDVRLAGAGAALTVVWLIAFSNGYNFMDGIDGIAALHAGIASLFFAVAGFLDPGPGDAWLAVPLGAACLSFLTVNWSPARVFMGDVASLPVGFLLAFLATRQAGFVSGFLFLGPFLFDTAFTLLRRASRRENLLAAHRSHLYQRLVLGGWSHARVTLLYGGWTVLTGAMGLLYLSGSEGVRIAALGMALASGIGVVLLVHRRERIQGVGQ
jgi:UDP-N-acetylmuramyl pentapeptide phosphotransferase/UDP-N-acetylglucosamine-1-phosphate transferase